MKINHLTESKKLPGQFGAKIMSPEEFVKADEQGIDVDPNEHGQVDEDNSGDNIHHRINRLQQMITDFHRRAKMSSSDIRKNHYLQMADTYTGELQDLIDTANEQERDGNIVAQHDSEPSDTWNRGGLKEGFADTIKHKMAVRSRAKNIANIRKKESEKSVFEKDPEAMREFERSGGYKAGLDIMGWQVGWAAAKHARGQSAKEAFQKLYYGGGSPFPFDIKSFKLAWVSYNKHHGPEAAIEEATELPAPQKEFGDDEFQDYMQRIVGTPDIDKKTGLPKMTKGRTTKTGIVHPPEPKFVSGKTKADKFKMPYVHRSSVVTYYDASGKRFRDEDVINALKQRPKKLLKQNEKMKHSNGALEQFFNIGFAALTGIAVDESTGKLIIVNTCPGAGSCKVDCFAMKGGKVQFKNAWLSDGKILTYLLNDPKGFFSQLDSEIKHESKLGDKGVKDENGKQVKYAVTIRWHDAGDFFSPEYLNLAFDIAKANPNVKFYAYTKMASAALSNKPDNFIINWSEGAHTSQEKQVKANDANLENTKNSRIVPEKLFYDLLKKDAKGNLDKEGADEEGKGGRWVMRDEAATKELKQRLADYYGISASSILSYDEYTSKKKVEGMKYNVIVAPGEGDISANDPNVLSTLLLKH